MWTNKLFSRYFLTRVSAVTAIGILTVGLINQQNRKNKQKIVSQKEKNTIFYKPDYKQKKIILPNLQSRYYFQQPQLPSELGKTYSLSKLANMLFTVSPDAFINLEENNLYIESMLTGTVLNHTLADWIVNYHNNHEFINEKPGDIACALAFDLLLGKSLNPEHIMVLGPNSNAYPIEHADAFSQKILIIENEQQLCQLLFDSLSDINHDCLELAKPVLQKNISNNFHHVQAFYQRFMDLSDEQFYALVKNNKAFSAQQKENFVKNLRRRQSLLRQHFKLESKAEIEDNSSKPSCALL